ncbi:uncharacterized protein LOC131077716 isoform X1 [Cryptomeria japonica]|uniref:uncharacterized protein LOC131077716 isoform X1 n=1 Tax=Cryptomeria japonica TaxID=3369 RepID=UPI0027DA70F0|nr:uncharacterized protein LOC131077716 isoform X1 [Cryptomeria japonica]XP_057871237.2 uncharacterized protein LOC131077716 isoform X1 [Cryptomeria japonica]
MVSATNLEYWLHWQALFCEFVVLLTVAAAALVVFKYRRVWKWWGEAGVEETNVYDEDLWRPCFNTIKPAGFLAFRAIAFFLMVGILSSDAILSGVFIFYFYTQWTFTLVIIYFGLATLISAKGCRQLAKNDSIRNQDVRANFLKTDLEQEAHVTESPGKNLDGDSVKLQSHQEREEQKKRAGFWGYAMQIIFQTCAGAVMMTDIVFWFIIVPFLTNEHFRLNPLMGSMHSVNALFLVIDAALNSMSFPWFRGAYFVLWTALYVVFQWILHACGLTWWPYPFLELSTPWAPLWYFGLAIVCLVCYTIFTFLIKAKEKNFPKWFPYAYQRLH